MRIEYRSGRPPLRDLARGIAATLMLGLLAGTSPALAGPDLLSGDGSLSTCATSPCATGYFAPNSTGASSPTGWNTTSTDSFLILPSALTPVSGTGYSTLTTPGPSGAVSMNFAGLSPDGGNFLIQDGNGDFYQTLSLVTGQSYAVSFYQAAAQQSGATGATTDQWQVGFFNPATGASTTQNSALMSISATGGYTGWVKQTFTFVAIATNEILGFSAIGTGNAPFAALDGVTVVAVPEPSSLALLGAGLCALIGIRRRAPTFRTPL